MQPVGVDDGMAARLGDVDVLHARGPQVGCHELRRCTAVGGVGGDAGDAGNAEQGLERFEARVVRLLEEPLQGRVGGWYGGGVRHSFSSLVYAIDPADCIGQLPPWSQRRLAPA